MNDMTIRSSTSSSVAITRLVCSFLLLVSTCSQAQSSLNLDEKLAAIRQGFVQAAIEGPTKVQSTVWIDGNGALQESSTFRTGMQVRGVKILSYDRDELGQPVADMHWQAEPANKSVKNTNQASPACDAIPRDGGLKHVVGFSILTGEEWAIDEMTALRASTDLMSKQWLRLRRGNVLWKQQLSGKFERSAYEKAFLGSSADEMPWQASLTISPVTRQPTPISPSLPSTLSRGAFNSPSAQPSVELRFTLTARHQHAPTFEASTQIMWALESQNWSPPVLTPESQQLLLQQVRNWALDVQKLLACEPVMPEVIGKR